VPAIDTTFPPDTASVRTARRAVVDALDLEGQAARDVELMASELIANAVIHAGTPVTVSARRRGDVVRVEVTDESSGRPRVKRHSAASPTGRGLHVVEALATTWGIDPAPTGPGKTVWFELRLDGAP
jgi:anti-sigma regulatory factor (Ser/Thr protein kinase)